MCVIMLNMPIITALQYTATNLERGDMRVMSIQLQVHVVC